MEHAELNYEMSGGRNYLSVVLSEEVNSYQLKMLESNEIAGILPVHSLWMNGAYKLQYDITGKSRLADWLNQGTGSREARRKMLYSFVYAMIHADDYLLTCKQFLLEKEYIYLNAGGAVSFVYLPFAGRTAAEPEKIRNFLKNLLLEHFTADGDNYFLNLLRYVSMPEYSLAGMLEKLEETGSKQEHREERVPESREREPEKVPEKVLEKTSEKVLEAGFADRRPVNVSPEEKKASADKKETPAALFGFEVPGMPAVPFPDSNRKESEKEKKKEKKEWKGIFWSHKKAEEPEKNNFSSKVPEKKLQGSCPEKEDEPWKGTRIIGSGAEEGATIMINSAAATKTAFLSYGNERIVITKFPFYIGREKGDHLIKQPNVSGKHAYIGSRDGMYFIVDENSSNHTYINGKVIVPYTEMEIVSGDTIRLAGEAMTFYVENM